MNAIALKGELENLKQQWLSDPCWDIESTEGFEQYKQELYIFRLEHELKAERRQNQRYQKFFQELNVLATGKLEDR